MKLRELIESIPKKSKGMKSFQKKIPHKELSQRLPKKQSMSPEKRANLIKRGYKQCKACKGFFKPKKEDEDMCPGCADLLREMK